MAESRTERQLLEEISAKLDKVIGSLAIAGREQTAQITILKSFGFDWKDIGLLVGLTPDAARMRFTSLKKKPAKGRSKSPAKGAE